MPEVGWGGMRLGEVGSAWDKLCEVRCEWVRLGESQSG